MHMWRILTRLYGNIMVPGESEKFVPQTMITAAEDGFHVLLQRP